MLFRSPNTLAAETAGDAAETARTPYPVPVAHFVAGENIIAVEVHQAAPNSSDLGFDGALWIRRITSADPAPPPPPSPDLVRGEAVPIPADFSAWLFTHDVVHRVELVLPQRSVDALNLVPQTLAVSEVRIDGQRVVETGVRLRGSGDAFRPLADKPRLQLDFDHFAPDRTFYGLTSLTLNNSAGDCSRMREVMAHDVFAAAGLPTPRAAFAHVFVNGEDYGLYVLVESQDEVWLQRHYAEADGTLYDGGPVPNERGEPVFLDLERALIPLFPRLAGENDRRADLREVVEAVEGNAGRPTFYDAVGEVVDWEIFHKHAAAEIWTGHGLGYLGRGGGYRIYFDPQDEKMDFSPWDLESAFHPEEAFDCPFAEPCGVLARLCWADEDCFAAQRATVIALDDTLAGRDMVGLFDAANALTRATAVANPRDACTPVQLDEARARIRAWLETRSEAVRAGFAP